MFFLSWAGIGRASVVHAMTMDEFKAQFEGETGKSWDTAIMDEKRDFVRKTTERTEEQRTLQHGEKEDSAGDVHREWIRGVLIEVRTQYEKEYGQDWDEAAPEDQEAFLIKYKKQRQEEEQLKQYQLLEESMIQQEKEAQKQMEIMMREQRKVEEEQKRVEKERAMQAEREAERQKLQDTLDRIQKMRDEFKLKRQQ